MPGQPTFSMAGAYGGYSAPAATPVAAGGGGGSHASFVIWLVIIGVLLPVFIIGGLNVSGFKFVFKGR